MSCSVDATRVEGKGRYINDGLGKQKNVVPKVVLVNGEPRICFFAIKNIPNGNELRYDYGVSGLPWRDKLHRKQVTQINCIMYRW